MICMRLTRRRRPWRLAGVLFISTSTKTTTSCLSTAAYQHRHSSSKIAVIGGGASGIFASIAAAEYIAAEALPIKVVVLEATNNPLQKVKISGGGRCNVLHDTSKPVSTILSGYPRGQRELNGIYQRRFTPAMAQEWFEQRGVQLKVEEDGRMFPVTDSSQTIIDTLMNASKHAGVEVRLRQKVFKIDCLNHNHDDAQWGKFSIHFKDGSKEDFCAVVLATGSSPAGYSLARSLGHDPLVDPIPSLFTLNCKSAVSFGGVLHGLAGISLPSALLSLSLSAPLYNSSNLQSDETHHNMDGVKIRSKKKRKTKESIIAQEGPLLITHHGISGPATLRLSAFGARDFHDLKYKGKVMVNWDAPVLGRNAEHLLNELWKFTSSHPKRTVVSVCPLPGNSIPRRLWSALVHDSGLSHEITWGSAPKKLVRQLANNLIAYPLEFTGKGTFKEEFVTAGGVNLAEIDMKTMESKICRGLYLCGEIINVDGVTGGYNFMNCWSTGFIAGESSAQHASLAVRGRNGT